MTWASSYGQHLLYACPNLHKSCAAALWTSKGLQLWNRTARQTWPGTLPRRVQAIGISLWANAKSSPDGTESQYNTGCAIMLAGLAIQVKKLHLKARQAQQATL